MHPFNFVAHLLVQQLVLGEVMVLLLLLLLFSVFAVFGFDARVEDFNHEEETKEEFHSAHRNAAFVIHINDTPSILRKEKR